MAAATILFTDIVSFSKKPTAEQRRLVESLTWPCRTIHTFSAYKRSETNLTDVLKEVRHGRKEERDVQDHKLERI